MTALPESPPRQGPRPFEGWGAHAGLGRHQPGGTPTLADLHRALGLGLAYLEVDILVTADGRLVLRHDHSVEIHQPRRTPMATAGRIHLPRRGERILDIPVAELTLAELRATVPHTLTLDEAVALVAGRTPLLFDVKNGQTAGTLGTWLAGNHQLGDFAVCTESLTALATLRDRSPATPRWLTLPDIPTEMRHPVWSMIRGVLRERDPRELARAFTGVLRALAESHPRMRMGPFQGVTWRPYLRAGLQRLVSQTGASGLCVHQWLVTRELVEAAHDLGIPITAWTVNNERDARRVIGLGVDYVTSDDPAQLRRDVQPGALRRLLAGLTGDHDQLSA